MIICEYIDIFYTQVSKASADWELIKTELLQVGTIYDEGIAANLEQVLPPSNFCGAIFLTSYIFIFIYNPISSLLITQVSHGLWS